MHGVYQTLDLCKLTFLNNNISLRLFLEEIFNFILFRNLTTKTFSTFLMIFILPVGFLVQRYSTMGKYTPFSLYPTLSQGKKHPFLIYIFCPIQLFIIVNSSTPQDTNNIYKELLSEEKAFHDNICFAKSLMSSFPPTSTPASFQSKF